MGGQGRPSRETALPRRAASSRNGGTYVLQPGAIAPCALSRSCGARVIAFDFQPRRSSAPRVLRRWLRDRGCGYGSRRESYEKNAVRFAWREGDMITLDNMLTAHARDSFVGPRKIVVALGDLIEGAEVDRINSARA